MAGPVTNLSALRGAVTFNNVASYMGDHINSVLVIGNLAWLGSRLEAHFESKLLEGYFNLNELFGKTYSMLDFYALKGAVKNSALTFGVKFEDEKEESYRIVSLCRAVSSGGEFLGWLEGRGIVRNLPMDKITLVNKTCGTFAKVYETWESFSATQKTEKELWSKFTSTESDDAESVGSSSSSLEEPSNPTASFTEYSTLHNMKAWLGVLKGVCFIAVKMMGIIGAAVRENVLPSLHSRTIHRIVGNHLVCMMSIFTIAIGAMIFMHCIQERMKVLEAESHLPDLLLDESGGES